MEASVGEMKREGEEDLIMRGSGKGGQVGG